MDKAESILDQFSDFDPRNFAYCRFCLLKEYSRKRIEDKSYIHLKKLVEIYYLTLSKLGMRTILGLKNPSHPFLSKKPKPLQYLAHLVLISYNIFINLLSKDPTKKNGQIHRVFKDLVSLPGIEPDIYTFNTLINSCLLRNDKFQANVWMEKMKKYKIEPDVVTTTSWIVFFVKSGKWNEVSNMLQTMKELNIKPNSVTELSLMVGESRRNNTEAIRIKFWNIISTHQSKIPSTGLIDLPIEIISFILKQSSKDPSSWVEEILYILNFIKSSNLKSNLSIEELIFRMPGISEVLKFRNYISELANGLNMTIFYNIFQPENQYQKESLRKSLHSNLENVNYKQVPQNIKNQIYTQFKVEYLEKTSKEILTSLESIFVSLFIHMVKSKDINKALFLYDMYMKDDSSPKTFDPIFFYTLHKAQLFVKDNESSLKTLKHICKNSLFKYGYPISDLINYYLEDSSESNLNLPFLGIDPLTYINQSPNLFGYTSLLQYTSELQALGNLEYIWTCMLDSGIKPDSLAYLKRIKAHCLAGDEKKVKEMYWEMIDSNIKPSSHTIDFVFRSMFYDFDFPALVSVAYNSIVELGVSPNTLGMNYLIMAMFKNEHTVQTLTLSTQLFILMMNRESGLDYKKYYRDISLINIRHRLEDNIQDYKTFAPQKPSITNTMDNVESMVDWLSSNDSGSLNLKNSTEILYETAEVDKFVITDSRRNHYLDPSIQISNPSKEYGAVNHLLKKISGIIAHFEQNTINFNNYCNGEGTEIDLKKITNKGINIAPPPNLLTFTNISRYALKLKEYGMVIEIYEEFLKYKPFHKWSRTENPRFYGFVLLSYVATNDINGAKNIWDKMCSSGYILEEHKHNFDKYCSYYLDKSIKNL
ncbi:Pentatricopeptide repeat-containing protein [Smittium mucronatum]|uniref:Pentatricopeptide repeat-containing protein n=1 Tax=Smittium mucronatum TaxID=133383 RepID=A0A1R0GU86_9FUNG|nr:Pentatricopeptide repeat-containing protein [Smittium mucronatum]OLY80447.1 Pentatricopeptide repeat-containing protein [Smittium mucronatum]